MRLCRCRPALPRREDARDEGRRARRRMVTLEENPYPDMRQAGCDELEELGGTCALADAWQQGYAEVERELYEAALGHRRTEAAP